jgi:SAM-dependent methyltransferase
VNIPDRRDAVRRSYDEIAEDYAARIGEELRYKPLDRALLEALLEGAGPAPAVADLGCGPGHVAGWLSARGARVVGIDLSPRMIAIARRDHPDVEFREGDLLELPAAGAEFDALLALYSVIHLPPGDLAASFAEMRRVVRPGGEVLVSFHVGQEVQHVTEWWGHDVDVDGYYRQAGDVAEHMAAAGLEVWARLERSNYPEEVATRRAYLLARRPAE